MTILEANKHVINLLKMCIGVALAPDIVSCRPAAVKIIGNLSGAKRKRVIREKCAANKQSDRSNRVLPHPAHNSLANGHSKHTSIALRNIGSLSGMLHF